MASPEEQEARRAVRDAQAQYERERDKARATRRKAFAAAQRSGLSLRQIADEVGVHHSTVAEIIAGR
jgi:DNA-directed RNA polymerase specialized sigma24 family protein